MTKKKKFHDPMKYVTEDVVGTSITYKITRKEKHTKYMNTLMARYLRIAQEMHSKMQNGDCMEVFNNYKTDLNRISAQHTAEFLIANNIAHRGEPLHASTALHELKKMQYQGSIQAVVARHKIQDSEIKNLTFSEDEQHEQNLHYFLYKKYGVMLLNASTYDCCTKMIDKYKSWGKAGADKLRHYENFAKKFYKSDIQVTR